MSIYIDCREKDKVKKAFFTLGSKLNTEFGTDFKLISKTLVCGDFIIQIPNGKISMIFERKTAADAASSIVDGRFDSQRARMCEARTATGCSISYILEGKKISKTKMTYDSVMCKMESILIRYNVPHIVTNNLEHTIKTIFRYAVRSMNLFKRGVFTGYNEPEDVEHKETKDDAIAPISKEIMGSEEISLPTLPAILVTAETKSPEAVQQLMWKSIPGVGEETYEVLERIPICDIVLGKWRINDLCALKYTKSDRNLSERIARYILTIAYRGDDLFTKAAAMEISIDILACIPGVTKASAKLILSQYSLYDLCVSTTTAEIAKISKGKRLIGKAVATRIIEYIRWRGNAVE